MEKLNYLIRLFYGVSTFFQPQPIPQCSKTPLSSILLVLDTPLSYNDPLFESCNVFASHCILRTYKHAAVIVNAVAAAGFGAVLLLLY